MLILKNSKKILSLLATVLCLMIPSLEVNAERYETNSDTSYWAYIDDEADLLSDSRELELIDDMMPLTAYTNVAFKSINENHSSTESYAYDYANSLFAGPGVVFLIDMDHRNIWIWSVGSTCNSLTTAKSNTITDNVYHYAEDGDYYRCASRAFEQMGKVMSGQKIAQPMRIISAAILAVICSIFVNFCIVIKFSRAKKTGNSTIAKAACLKIQPGEYSAYKLHTSKKYNPSSSSSGGSSGGGGGGGGCGGGHGF